MRMSCQNTDLVNEGMQWRLDEWREVARNTEKERCKAKSLF